MSVVSVDVSYDTQNSGREEIRLREIVLAEEDGTVHIYKRGYWSTIEGPPALRDNNNE